MRLIDVDALLDDCIFTSKGLEMFVKEFLDDAPTVDAVPREELLNTLSGRLDFLKKWRNETADFKNIATAMIEDCEDIIDIIKSLKEKADGKERMA